MKIKPFDIVVVTWEDALGDTARQATTLAEALASYTPTIRRTVGFFVAQTKNVVIVASDDDRTSASDSQALGGFVYIPRGVVREIQHVASLELTEE